MAKSVVLLSSGLDSSFNLFKAQHENLDVVLALTFNYGQMAASKEIAAAAALAKQAAVPHQVVDVTWFADFTKTSLISGRDLPSGADVTIDSHERSLETAKSVWVPNRNGILLNIAAGFAEGLGAGFVIPGFNVEEASTFPDNSQGFLQSLDHSWSFSTASKVRTRCFSTDLNKTEIVREAKLLRLQFSKLWPCYRAEAKWCGQCESCLRFKRAIAANDLDFEALRRDSGK